MTTNGANRPINTILILTILIINTKYINLTIGNIIINHLDAHHQLISMNPFTKRRNIVLSCCSFILSHRVNISPEIILPLFIAHVPSLPWQRLPTVNCFAISASLLVHYEQSISWQFSQIVWGCCALATSTVMCILNYFCLYKWIARAGFWHL